MFREVRLIKSPRFGSSRPSRGEDMAGGTSSAPPSEFPNPLADALRIPRVLEGGRDATTPRGAPGKGTP